MALDLAMFADGFFVTSVRRIHALLQSVLWILSTKDFTNPDRLPHSKPTSGELTLLLDARHKVREDDVAVTDADFTGRLQMVTAKPLCVLLADDSAKNANHESQVDAGDDSFG